MPVGRSGSRPRCPDASTPARPPRHSGHPRRRAPRGRLRGGGAGGDRAGVGEVPRPTPRSGRRAAARRHRAAQPPRRRRSCPPRAPPPPRARTAPRRHPRRRPRRASPGCRPGRRHPAPRAPVAHGARPSGGSRPPPGERARARGCRHTLAVQAAQRREREQLDQLRRPPMPPSLSGYDAPVHANLERSEQADAQVGHKPKHEPNPRRGNPPGGFWAAATTAQGR